MKSFIWFVFSVLFGTILGLPKVSGQVAAWDYGKSDSLFKSGAYAEALQENLKALRFVEKSGSCTEIVHAHIQIGRIHYFLTNRQEAIRWFRKSLPMARACGVDSLVGKCYKNLGALFFENEQLDSAVLYLENASLFLSRSHNAKDLSQLYSSLFEVYAGSKKEANLAKNYLDSCGKYATMCGDPDQFAFYQIKLGRYYYETGNCRKAIVNFQELIKYYQKRNFKDGLMYTLSNLALAQAKCGEGDSSVATMMYRDQVKETIFREKTAENLAKYEALYDTQKKEIENLELRQKNKWLISWFTVGFLVFLILGIGGYKFQQLRIQRKQAEQKKEEQRQRFLEVIQVQEQERTRIAGDLHDGLGHLMAALKLNTSALSVTDESNGRILENAQTIIDQASREVRQISHQLMPQSLSEIGILASLQELANRINPTGKIQIRILNEEEMPLSREMQVAVYRLVQEVLNNAMKHSGATEFCIGYTITNHVMTLVLEDNGVGMERSAEQNSKGIGWKNIRSRVEIIGGQMKVFSEKNQGLKIEFEIPLDSGTLTHKGA